VPRVGELSRSACFPSRQRSEVSSIDPGPKATQCELDSMSSSNRDSRTGFSNCRAVVERRESTDRGNVGNAGPAPRSPTVPRHSRHRYDSRRNRRFPRSLVIGPEVYGRQPGGRNRPFGPFGPAGGPPAPARKPMLTFRGLYSTDTGPMEQVGSIARTHVMKIISHKQREQAMHHVAELLKRDGWTETMTVQQWLDHAEYRPAQFQASMQALEVLGLLGFGEEQVRASQPT
jgi:hypothetical protein